jgi:hypothetical protein
MPEDPAASAQPEGQGGEGNQDLSGFAQEFLSSVPDDQREIIAPHLKSWDANVTRKFQDAASYRQQWEPYEQIGVHEYDPDSLKQALEILSDEERLNEWIVEQAQARGLTKAEAEAEAQGSQGQGDYLTREELQAIMAERDQSMQAAIEQADREEAAAADLTSSLTELRQKHGFKEGSEEEEDILDVASGMLDRNPGLGLDAVSKAAERYYSRLTKAENGVLGDKLNQPQTPETGGRAVGPSGPKTREEVMRAAKARFEASLQ